MRIGELALERARQGGPAGAPVFLSTGVERERMFPGERESASEMLCGTRNLFSSSMYPIASRLSDLGLTAGEPWDEGPMLRKLPLCYPRGGR